MPRKKTDKKYKIKTHKATAKRFKLTGSGKLMRTKIGKGHLRRNTSKRTKRLLSEMIEVTSPSLKRRIRRLAPYLGKYKYNPPA
jgi:large subunit ribosomal protein L35